MEPIMNKSDHSELIPLIIRHLKSLTEDLLQYSQHEKKTEEPPPPPADSIDKSAVPPDDSLLVRASLVRYGRVYMTKSNETETQNKTK
jgi:hypothetical protein